MSQALKGLVLEVQLLEWMLESLQIGGLVTEGYSSEVFNSVLDKLLWRGSHS